MLQIDDLTFKWSTKAPWKVRAAVADGLERSGKHVVQDIRRAINVPFPPASSPGEPPHKRTGNLRANIAYKVNRKTLEVYIAPTEDAYYGFYLEYGAPRANLEPRPFLGVTIRENKTRIKISCQRAAAKAFRKHAGKL